MLYTKRPNYQKNSAKTQKTATVRHRDSLWKKNVELLFTSQLFHKKIKVQFDISISFKFQQSPWKRWEHFNQIKIQNRQLLEPYSRRKISNIWNLIFYVIWVISTRRMIDVYIFFFNHLSLKKKWTNSWSFQIRMTRMDVR